MPAPLAHLSFATLWQPSIIAQAVIVQVLYLLVVYRFGKRVFRGYQPVEPARVVSFLAGRGCRTGKTDAARTRG